MWAGPRNVSTALMYAFAQRQDTKVVDEPLYGHYLHTTQTDHPGKEEVLASMETDGNKVVSEVIFGPCLKPILFVKNMAHHCINLPFSFLEGMVNLFLIRHPAQVIHSFAKTIAYPNMRDVAFEAQYQLFQYLVQSGREPLVMDSSRLLSDPSAYLLALCRQLDIPWYPAMLTWNPGPITEDGIWAKYWYQQVHQSTGLITRQPDLSVKVPEHLQPLQDACMPFYEAMLQKAIHVTS
jgi:hypothetical protein